MIMKTLLGRLSAQPTESGNQPSDEMIALINARIAPPQPLRADQVHLRSVRLVSDEVNDHGGRFPADEHERLCELIVDSPVLIGHDRSRLPVARNFAARCTNDGERQWVTVWFYWLRGADGDRLAADIDGGVVKEGSIGFEFRLPRCSICGADIRRCEHIPGQQYTDNTGATRVAHYEYRDIIRVLETSLVYRGATPGTRIGNEAVFCKTGECTMRAAEEGTVGVVLDRQSLGTGASRYIIARRDPNDPTVCDEILAITDTQLEIGDRVRLESGEWVSNANERKPITVEAYICGRPKGGRGSCRAAVAMPVTARQEARPPNHLTAMRNNP
jgi:hypothetical protein